MTAQFPKESTYIIKESKRGCINYALSSIRRGGSTTLTLSAAANPPSYWKEHQQERIKRMGFWYKIFSYR